MFLFPFLSDAHAHARRSWGAVVMGSVLKGAGVGAAALPTVGVCPRSYGITLSQKFAAHLMHGEGDVFTDKLHGSAMARNQIVWLVRKGDLIPPGGPIVATYNLACNFTNTDIAHNMLTRVSLVASDSDERATRLSDLVDGTCFSRSSSSSSSSSSSVTNGIQAKTRPSTSTMPTPRYPRRSGRA